MRMMIPKLNNENDDTQIKSDAGVYAIQYLCIVIKMHGWYIP